MVRRSMKNPIPVANLARAFSALSLEFRITSYNVCYTKLLRKFSDGNSAFRNSKDNALKALAKFATGMGFFIDLLTILVLGFGGFFAYKQIITVGELAGFLLFINLMTQPVIV